MKNWVVRGICGDLTLLHKKQDLNWLRKGKRQTFFLKVENFKSTLQKNTLKNTLWSINILKSCLQDVSKTSPRRLQDVSKTSWRHAWCLQDVFKTSSRRLGVYSITHFFQKSYLYWNFPQIFDTFGEMFPRRTLLQEFPIFPNLM